MVNVQQTKEAQILTPQDLRSLRYPLSQSWRDAAGMLKCHRKDLEHHIKQVRKEWGRRHVSRS